MSFRTTASDRNNLSVVTALRNIGLFVVIDLYVMIKRENDDTGTCLGVTSASE
jgi:hypothetical protein